MHNNLRALFPCYTVAYSSFFCFPFVSLISKNLKQSLLLDWHNRFCPIMRPTGKPFNLNILLLLLVSIVTIGLFVQLNQCGNIV